MKKHDEGYVLAYVMVIIAILALIAASVHSVALNNLQKQQVEVEKMQAKYAAQGELEQIIARLDELRGKDEFNLLSTVIGESENVAYTVQSCKDKVCVVRISVVESPVIIECDLEITSDSQIWNDVTSQHGLTKLEWRYVSYKISTAEEAGGGGDT